MDFVLAVVWPQPLNPLHSIALSALVAAVPLILVLVLMGGYRKSGLFASAWGLGTAGLLALLIWHMPLTLVLWSAVYGFIYAVWPILWIVFGGLWLYNLTQDTGKFELLRRWMEEHASGDPCIQAILVAFCFGALLEGSAGFGTPVAVTACLLAGLGLEPRRAVIVALIANTAPVAFGGLGLPIVALAGVTGLDLYQLSSMAGRQVPFLSFILPAYLVWVVARGQGLRRTWPAALVAGSTFALAQFLVSNLWGPYATDIIAASASIAALVTFLRFWVPDGTSQNQLGERSPAPLAVADPDPPALSSRQAIVAWLPWVMLAAVMVLWSYLKLFQVGQIIIPIPKLHNNVIITLYQKPYSALYSFQPLGIGTAVLAATVLTALCIRAGFQVVLKSGSKTLRQLRLPGLTVMMIVGLAYLYNYSGMAYTLGAAVARIGPAFPLVSSYLGWVACFLSGSDTASNLLFGNLQVAAAHQLHLSPVLLAAMNSSGAVTGKMISPQNIAVGVTTVALIGQEGRILRGTFWHSVLLAFMLGLVALAQAYWLPGMVP
ncbi:MAG TPA: L-lactate permease [Terriglobia bacterium]|nr:L-lactate permease [Terriglobia bacterium]